MGAGKWSVKSFRYGTAIITRIRDISTCLHNSNYESLSTDFNYESLSTDFHKHNSLMNLMELYAVNLITTFTIG